MDESVKLNKKVKKHQLDKKQKNSVSKDTLESKVNTLEVTTKKGKADNTWPKPMSSTELYSSFNIPDILVTTPQKHDAINHKAVLPYTKRKFSGDNTSHDGEPIQENLDHTEASEERRIRTKSLPQPPSHSAADGFASAPLPVDNTKEKEDATQGLLNKRFSLATKNDYASVPLSFHTASKLGAKNLIKSVPTITLSEPISLDSYASDMPRPPVQIVDHKYVNNSPRKTLQQRSKSVTEPPKIELTSAEEESGYFKNLYNSMKNKFGSKNKLQSQTQELNEKDVILPSHPQSQPQMLSQIKQSVALKQNAKLPNKTDPESKHNIAQNQSKVTLDVKSKTIDGVSGQKFAKLPPQAFVKTNEKSTTPLKHDNTMKLPNQKLPPTTNLNKPGSKLAINHQNNSELEGVKMQLLKQQEQLDQLMGQQDKQQPIVTSYPHQHNAINQNKPQSTGNSYFPSNKGSSLNTIFQLVQATEPRPTVNLHLNLNPNLAGANHDDHTDSTNKYIYDKTDH
jgi:hypothetical protein